ncbi:MAG: Cof-type HAD-IIB family hydrolase [Spirochaetaceae bacterium]|jgi:Cof subfamily protein (haloacid dehalogenase superfamily)|nr:Cof-type HAD-IIB family hydrolase [Spirochaetaceae bacterium]
MNAIRMLALDLDDTLLRSDLTISFRTRSLIKKASGAGIVIVLASGRVVPAMETYVRQLGLHASRGYVISGNGIEIRESDTGMVVHRKELSGGTAELVYRYADAEGFPVQMYEGDRIYVSRHNEYADYDESITGLKQAVVNDFPGRVAHGCGKLLIPGDPMILGPLETILRAYLGDRITLFTSKPYFLEILPPGTDKGTALARLAEHLGIRREAVMAVGDSMNDEAMIKWAGVGVAMRNGDERLKSAADLVTAKSHDEEGVALLLENLLGELPPGEGETGP